MSNRLPGWQGVLEAALEEALARAGRSGMTATALRAAAGGEWSAEEVADGLVRLGRDGRAVEWNRRWYLLRNTGWSVGRVRRGERGDAVVSAGDGTSFFVRRANLKGAGEGVRVLVKPVRGRGRRRGRGSGQLAEATVLTVLERAPTAVVGWVERRDGEVRLVPFDPRSPLDVVVEGADEVADRTWVVVEPSSARPGALPGRARLSEILGPVAEPGVDVLVVLRHYDIPDRFPAEVAAAARRLPQDPRKSDRAGREDLRDRLLVTVDGETARDFDDAISVEGRPRGGFELGVHIADVAHYVDEGGTLDLEAYHRGTSVYYPDRAVPMLPERLSNGLCSLRPGVPRLALSVFLELDADGEVVGRRFAETIIRSGARLTYGEVAAWLEAGDGADGDPEVGALLRRAERLMRRLHRRRVERGSIDFDLPEGDVILDEEGFTVGVRPGRRTAAHRIIEEFMIAANEAVAEELESHDAPALFRVHDPPGAESLEELRIVLAPLGLRLAGDLTDVHPRALAGLLERVEGRPEEPFVSSLVLRSMQRALYSPEPRGHYALATRHYLHFTSPIRRYPDLVVHRRLKSLLRGDAAAAAAETGLDGRLEAMAGHCSTTERRAERSERDLLQWKLVRFLSHRIGESFRGRVSGVQPFGLFVQLEEYFVDGLVPIRSLADDFYVYDAESHTLEGREHGRVFRLADPVEVELTGVSLRHRGLDLKVRGMPEPAAPEPRRGRRRGQRSPRRSSR